MKAREIYIEETVNSIVNNHYLDTTSTTNVDTEYLKWLELIVETQKPNTTKIAT